MRRWSVLFIIMAVACSVGGCKKKPKRAKPPAYPLHSAASRGDLEAVQRLLYRGADVNARDYDGETPLHGAALGGHVLIAQTLIAHDAEIDPISDSNCTPLHGAAGSGEANMVELLLENGASGNVQGAWRAQMGTPLHLAAQRGHQRIVRLLCEGGADVSIKNEDGRMALELAVSRDKREIAEFLAAAGSEMTPLAAAYLGDMERLKQAVAEGHDIDASPGNGLRALHWIAKWGHREMAALLLDHGAEVNPEYLTSPLHLAAARGHEGVVRLLLDRGADVDVVDLFGSTALNDAIYSDRVEVVRLLLVAGADANVANSVGWTSLHSAANISRKEIARRLRDELAALGAAEKGEDIPPPEKAPPRENLEVVRLLLAHGADPNARTTKGQTPLDVAIQAGRADVAELLRQHMAKP